MNDNPEFVDLFQELDGMVNAFDAEGAGPLRKGQQPFSWAVVESLAAPLAEAVPDLRVGIWLLRAELAREGLPGLVRGMNRLATWMELPAEELHPVPEAGEHPRELHALLLRWLSTPAFLGAVRDAPVGPQASLSMGELLESAPTTAVLPALAACPAEDVLSHLKQVATLIQRLELALANDATDADLSLGMFGEIVSGAERRLVGCIESNLPSVVDPTLVAETDRMPPDPVDEQVAVAHAPGRSRPIQSREEVQTALAGLVHYFEQHEPGHPAPIFLKRIERMLGASFENLLQELFPDANQLAAKLHRPVSA